MRSSDSQLDTSALGLALRFQTPSPLRTDYPSLYRIEFDTGVVLYLPEVMFLDAKFHLQESDPPARKGRK